MMPNRPAPISQANATRYLKAAALAGYERARLIIHTDGRIEVIAENGESITTESPLEAWRRENAD